MKAIKVIAAVMSIVLLAGAAGCDSAGDSKAKKQMEETLDSYMQRVFDDRPAGRYVDTKEEATFSVTEEQNEICCAVQDLPQFHSKSSHNVSTWWLAVHISAFFLYH